VKIFNKMKKLKNALWFSVLLLSFLVVLVMFNLAACQELSDGAKIPATEDYPSLPTLIGSPGVPELGGVTWLLNTYQDQKGNQMNLIPDTRITAIFMSGELQGESGCNQYTAAIQLEEERMKIEDITVTEKYCMQPEKVMQQEQVYLEKLSNVTQYSIDGNRLQLKNQQGNTILIFIGS